jgi:UDPglucose 6-dehydrogenase
MRYVDSPYAAAQDADALVILNEWQEFADLDLQRLHYTLRYPIIIDGRNLYDPAVMMEHGFTYLSVGRPGLSHTRDAAVGQRLP